MSSTVMIKNNRNLKSFEDILLPRREEGSNLMWVSRKLNLAVAYEREIRPKPDSIKQHVMDSIRMQEIIENVCAENDISKTELLHQIKLILDEIGFKKHLKVIRWLGYVLAKICQKVCSGIYVNQIGINKIKAKMGNCPVIYAPSHRSYGDFILMSYLLFTYDMEIPSIAAGMDFHGMTGMGTVLRNTGAFFMRRSYNDDRLYWDTFKTYVHNLITQGELPIEFFIEGTRSRSCKSLVPKFGLLSMMLKPFFIAEVPDILIVPINISYDRILEEKLFAFELLGIPKPKESTSGFFKSLSIVKEKYGNIYVDFTEPISLKEYFGEKLNRSKHAMKPIHQQELDHQERSLISDIAYEIVHTQQNNSVISTFNLLATLLSNRMISNEPPYKKDEMINDIKWFKVIMEVLGGLASTDNDSFEETMIVHKNIVKLDENGKVVMIHLPLDLSNIDLSKLKGHALNNKTMTLVVPLIMLQLYINPCLHFLVNCSLIVIILKSIGQNREIFKDELFRHYQFLRTVFSHEFVFVKKWEKMDFEQSIQKLNHLKVIEATDMRIMIGENDKLQTILCNMMLPFFSSYNTVYYFLLQTNSLVGQQVIFSNVQRIIENVMATNLFVHPYTLNLDTIGICLQNLVAFKVLEQQRIDGKVKYKVNYTELKSIAEKIGKYSCIYNLPVRAEENIKISAKL